MSLPDGTPGVSARVHNDPGIADRFGEVVSADLPARCSVAAALRVGAAALGAAGIEAPLREVRLLLGAALGWRRERLLVDDQVEIDTALFAAWLKRRAGREPLALIVGRREFWSMEFEVSADTLIPRPDSESLIEAALEMFPDRGRVARVLDLGTGTGCLLLAALSEFAGAFGVGVDRAAGTARLAARNAARLGFGGRSAFVVGDWADALAGRFDLVLSNPPYIETADIAGLMPEVASFEPASALDGGADGLDCYRVIVAALPRLLAPGGIAVLELGIGQAQPVRALGHISGLGAKTRLDLSGVARALIFKKSDE